MAAAQGPRPARPVARHYLTDTSLPTIATERRPVPVAAPININMTLASNNPFRRDISPNPTAYPLQPTQYRQPSNGVINNENRPLPPRQNTNPFLNNYQVPAYPVNIPSQSAPRSPSKAVAPPPYSMSTSPKKHQFGSSVPIEAMVCCFQCLLGCGVWVEEFLLATCCNVTNSVCQNTMYLNERPGSRFTSTLLSYIPW